MKLKTFCGLLMATAALAAAPASWAGVVVNGDFSAGLTGWSSLGDVTASGGSAQLSTASLYVDDAPAAAGAFNLSGTSAALVGVPGGVEAFSGLSLGSLDPDPAAGIWAFEGSALRQTLAVAAGDTLRLDWHFSSQEDPLTGMNDYAFLVIDGLLIRLTDVSNAVGSGQFSYSFNTAGTVELALGVVDVGDFIGTSTLGIDNVVLDSALAVPEPGSLALALLGLGMLRRRGRR